MNQLCTTLSNSLQVFMDKPMYSSKFLSVNSDVQNVSGLQGDSSLNMGSLAMYTQGTPLLITQVLQGLSEICRISMGNIMYIWTLLWTSFLVTGKKYATEMKKLASYQFPNTTARIGNEAFRLTFRSCPTKAICELSSLTTSYLAGCFSRQAQLLYYSLFYVLEVGSSSKFFYYVYHYWGKFEWGWQLSHASNLTEKRPVVNKFPHIALIKEYLCQYPIK